MIADFEKMANDLLEKNKSLVAALADATRKAVEAGEAGNLQDMSLWRDVKRTLTEKNEDIQERIFSI